MSRLQAVLEAGRKHREATGARDADGPVYRTWEREAGRALARQRSRENNDRERERDRDQGVLSQFEQLRIRQGEPITVEVPEFTLPGAIQVVDPGRYPMTKELVRALANTYRPTTAYTLKLDNRNDPHFTIDEMHNSALETWRDVVPSGWENRSGGYAYHPPPQRGEPGYDSDDLYS